MASTRGTFSGTGQSTEIPIQGLATLSISGTFTATIDLERKAPESSTWTVVESYTSAAEKNIEAVGRKWLYRLNCSSHSSGDADYAIGDS
jgi:hypothetical protein